MDIHDYNYRMGQQREALQTSVNLQDAVPFGLPQAGKGRIKSCSGMHCGGTCYDLSLAGSGKQKRLIIESMHLTEQSELWPKGDW